MNQETYTYTFPTWALSYLINGDSSALTEEEIKQVDEFVERENYIDVFTHDPEEEPYYSKHAEIGSFMHTECIDLIGISWE